MELVAQTDNGLRAEALVDEFQPDVVVLDLVLASVDGMSLLGAAAGQGEAAARDRYIRDLQ